MTRPPRMFEWLLRRSLPPGDAADSIRGDLLEELGIRMAIGATAKSILWLVLREAAWVVGVGLAAGLGGAWALSRIVSSLLFGIEPSDPASTMAAISVLAAAGALAAWLPARRASRVDPISALRYE